ncbi:hypothetical protein NPIL_301441 [Nephila pilipes]|uniref:Uncharacterized protein n=1 Tax=Nephila pilipes TaxID=299642 RepID=A0A8X6TRP6_NEPPI|nr:hypothetical protein NPIL_301441 [Nephila pilipes]
MNSTPNSTPANSPIPNLQGESACMARRKFAMEMEVLNMILSQSNLLGNIQRYPQYEDTELYQIEKNELKILERKRDQMVSAFQSIGPCEINSCPHHSHLNLNLSQNQNLNLSSKPSTSKQFQRKVENGFISPATRKTAKINSSQNPSQNLLITNNRFHAVIF